MAVTGNLNLPKGWSTTTLGSFMDFKNGANADKDAYGKGVKFVNVMDVFRKNYLSSDDITGSVEITDKQLDRYSVIKRDISFKRADLRGPGAAGWNCAGRETKNALLSETQP